jgi:hypothetical protein
VDICKLEAVCECFVANDLGCGIEGEVLNRGNYEVHKNHIRIGSGTEVVAVLAFDVGESGATVEAGCGDLGKGIAESYGLETIAVLERVVSDNLSSGVYCAGFNVEVDSTNENEILVSIVAEVKSAILFGVLDSLASDECVLAD